MSKLNFKGKVFKDQVGKGFSLSLFIFEEDANQIVYSPALDLSGYGKTEIEAKKSFNICFEEFITYTTNKDTLVDELKRLGWKIKNENSKKKNNYKSPELSDLLKTDDYLAKIFETKNFKKINEDLALPVNSNQIDH